jgi:hypothetical protein
MTSAIYAEGLSQDFITGKSLNREKIRIIQNEDPDISGLYPFNDEKEAIYQGSMPFINHDEPPDLFYLQTEKMHWTTFERVTRFDLLHRHLSQSIIMIPLD